MSRLFDLAREDGWTLTLLRAFGSAFRRLRDRLIAGRFNAPGFRIGRRPRVAGLAHIQLGRNFRAGDDLWLDAITAYADQTFAPQLIIGDNVNFSDRVHIGCIASITIGAGTLIGSRVLITDHAHGTYRGRNQTGPEAPPTTRPLHSPAAVAIGRNVWLGDGVAVLAGATIGDGAIIGANSVVTGAIPAATIAVGSPARPIRQWDPTRREWLPFDPQSLSSAQPASG